jgi:CSLREA domain-containing protein
MGAVATVRVKRVMSQGTCRRIANLTSVLAAAIIGLIAMLAATANATPYTVTTTSDISSSGQCTLRDAINAANGSVTSGSSCSAAGTGSDTITFSLTGTITLHSALPEITDAGLTITGPTTSPGIAIDGADTYQVLNMSGSTTLTIKNLSIVNGNGTSEDVGGGIENASSGILTVTNSIFFNNSAGTGERSEGGAIASGGGSTTVTNSTFYENSANQGGGGAIYAAGTLTVTNSTFYENSASGIGGGGITILSSGSGTTTITGTILAANTGGNCVTDFPITASYNIADDGTCFTNGVDGNKVVTSTSDIDLASTPAANGGPTFTLALTSTSSPAVDKVPASLCPATDQRGYIRPAPGQADCDMGAFELNALPPSTVNCSKAAASDPNLVALLPVYYPEQVTGVTDSAGPFNISLTGVLQSKPVTPLLCPNAFITGTTAFVRSTNQSVSGNLLYSIGFTATDTNSGESCTGAVPVCVQDLLHAGKPCTGTATYDATKCK